jgi:hypothetical protein
MGIAGKSISFILLDLIVKMSETKQYQVGTANYPFANIISGQYDTYIDSFFKVMGGLDASTVYVR